MNELRKYLKFFIKNAVTGEFLSYSYWKLWEEATKDVEQVLKKLEHQILKGGDAL